MTSVQMLQIENFWKWQVYNVIFFKFLLSIISWELFMLCLILIVSNLFSVYQLKQYAIQLYTLIHLCWFWLITAMLVIAVKSLVLKAFQHSVQFFIGKPLFLLNAVPNIESNIITYNPFKQIMCHTLNFFMFVQGFLSVQLNKLLSSFHKRRPPKPFPVPDWTLAITRSVTQFTEGHKQ